MEVGYKIVYIPKVVSDDIPKLSKTWRTRISFAILEKLTVEPYVFGKPLHASLRGYRKLRIGDYRVIFRIEEKRVVVVGILHRSCVYTSLHHRGKV